MYEGGSIDVFILSSRPGCVWLLMFIYSTCLFQAYVYSLYILELFVIMSVCVCVVSTSLVRVLLLVRKKVNWGIFFSFLFFALLSELNNS